MRENTLYSNSAKNRRFFLLNTELSHDLTKTDISNELLPIIRSNIFTISDDLEYIRVEGPDISYHLIDPFLGDGLQYFGIADDRRSAGQFFRSEKEFDICLEDSWSGLFISRHLASIGDHHPLTIIHLDDHTDMMSTLLRSDYGSLVDTITGHCFDPLAPNNWLSVIQSGAVGIGSFLTPFFFLDREVRVLHLKHDVGVTRSFKVNHSEKNHWLLHDLSFFDIKLQEVRMNSALPSHAYVVFKSASEMFSSLMPHERVIIHIDLDYFINDFNGNAVYDLQGSKKSVQKKAESKMNSFFRALNTSDIIVERWIIGASPGFCSGRHWEFLLERIRSNINRSIEICKTRFDR